ncbi:MAG: hypothetical protein PHT14_10745 [Petrimonas sp.]|nr:hypothetical protein [Petrimonas sp.]
MINIEDELFSDTETDYSFSELVAELERNGEILKQWESGAPDENAPKTETKNQ